MRPPKNDQTASHLRRVTALVALIAVSPLGGCLHAGAMRDSWQMPDEVIASLQIQPGTRIADLGSGNGYFTFRLAEATGSHGVVYAIDVDEEALADLDATSQTRGVSHVETVVAGEDDSGLTPASVDLIFLCNAYHHLSDRTSYFADLKQALRRDGRIAIIELDDAPWFIPFMSSHQTQAETIDAEMTAAGFMRHTTYEFLEYQNFQIYSPTVATHERS